MLPSFFKIFIHLTSPSGMSITPNERWYHEFSTFSSARPRSARAALIPKELRFCAKLSLDLSRNISFICENHTIVYGEQLLNRFVSAEHTYRPVRALKNQEVFLLVKRMSRNDYLLPTEVTSSVISGVKMPISWQLAFSPFFPVRESLSGGTL